jgi:hypothetical protein
MFGCNSTESPSTESPSTESPSTESPSTESPSTESPSTESPSTESSGTVNIQNIIAEHIEAVGGASAIQEIKTIRKFHSVISTAPTGNATGTIEDMFDLIADSGRIDVDLGLYKESKGWTGQQGWKTSSFEPLRDLTAEELPIEKIGVPVSIIFTLKDTFGSAAFLPATKSKFNDQDSVKVEIVGSPLALYVNAKTKLIEGMEIPNLLRITLSDYKKVSGVQVPYKTKVEIFAANSTFRCDLKKVEFNGKFDTDKFSKPDN